MLTRRGARRGPDRPSTDHPAKGPWKAFYELTKPGIVTFVVLTAGVSFYVASRGRPDLLALGATLVGTLMATAGSLALNQWVEREPDAVMERTRSRPLPSGRLQPREALAFGVGLLVGGIVFLALTVGALPSALAAFSGGAYVLVYTPLKKRTYHATLVGAVPGAMPALIGWSAATGGLGAGAAVLFGIAFLWQLPHVLALAWLLREDYQRAGFMLAPPSDPAGRRIGRHMIFHAALLIPVSVLPTLLHLTGLAYLLGAVFLGILLLGSTVAAWRRMTKVTARRVFLGSLLYQPLLLGLMLVDTVRV